MAILRVGPTSAYHSIAAAMVYAAPADTIVIEDNYSNENADVWYSGMTISGGAKSVGITLQLLPGVTSVALTGLAPISILDSSNGNAIIGNDGDNLITVTDGADAVHGGLGENRLVVDYRLAIGNVTGDSTSNFTEAGGGGRMVTITNGTVQHFTILTGNGADTITTGNGNDIIKTGNGASTISAGHGANIIVGGNDADTITALDGGNFVEAGNGSNTVTTGSGNDTIGTGSDTDTIVSGAGNDLITLRGGADSVNAGSGFDRIIVDYSAMITNVTGNVTSGNLGAGYSGQIASAAGDIINFVEVEAFDITTGSGDDSITTGDAADTLNGGLGSDTISAGRGNDILRLWGSAAGDLDVLNGGEGSDTVDFSGFGAAVWAKLDYAQGLEAWTKDETTGRTGGGAWREIADLISVENLTGTDFDDRLIGDNGANILRGGLGSDGIDGGGGDDILQFWESGVGDLDVLNGGAGSDTVDFSGFDAAVWVDLASTTGFEAWTKDEATAQTGGGAWREIADLTSIENLTGTAFDDRLIGNMAANVLRGGQGNDVLTGRGGSDHFEFSFEAGNVDQVGTITDFVLGVDVLSVNGLHDAFFFASSHWVGISDTNNGSARIELGSGDAILLNNLSVLEIENHYFI